MIFIVPLLLLLVMALGGHQSCGGLPLPSRTMQLLYCNAAAAEPCEHQQQQQCERIMGHYCFFAIGG